MAEGILFRSGEALVAGGPPGTAAEPEVIVGSLAGPVGIAMAHLIGDQAASSRSSTPTFRSVRRR